MKISIEPETDVLVEPKNMKHNVIYRGTIDPALLFIRLYSAGFFTAIEDIVIIIGRREHVRYMLHKNMSGMVMLEPNGTQVTFTQFVELPGKMTDCEAIGG